jgi:hypothetical protein
MGHYLASLAGVTRGIENLSATALLRPPRIAFPWLASPPHSSAHRPSHSHGAPSPPHSSAHRIPMARHRRAPPPISQSLHPLPTSVATPHPFSFLPLLRTPFSSPSDLFSTLPLPLPPPSLCGKSSAPPFSLPPSLRFPLSLSALPLSPRPLCLRGNSPFPRRFRIPAHARQGQTQSRRAGPHR